MPSPGPHGRDPDSAGEGRDRPIKFCPQCRRVYRTRRDTCPEDGTALEDAELAPGDVLAGKYRIDGFLKRGGMGSVYRATHVMLDKPVAIKLIKPELVTSEDTVRRFQRTSLKRSFR